MRALTCLVALFGGVQLAQLVLGLGRLINAGHLLHHNVCHHVRRHSRYGTAYVAVRALAPDLVEPV